MKIVWSIICLQYFGSINKMNLTSPCPCKGGGAGAGIWCLTVGACFLMIFERCTDRYTDKDRWLKVEQFDLRPVQR
jgi:hypothetical protein